MVVLRWFNHFRGWDSSTNVEAREHAIVSSRRGGADVFESLNRADQQLCAELSQVMINMLVHQLAPLGAAQLSEKRV